MQNNQRMRRSVWVLAATVGGCAVGEDRAVIGTSDYGPTYAGDEGWDDGGDDDWGGGTAGFDWNRAAQVHWSLSLKGTACDIVVNDGVVSVLRHHEGITALTQAGPNEQSEDVWTTAVMASGARAVPGPDGLVVVGVDRFGGGQLYVARPRRPDRRAHRTGAPRSAGGRGHLRRGGRLGEGLVYLPRR